MEDHKVEESLQKHVMEYHSYLWMRNRGMHIQDLLQDVPYCLRSDIFFFVAGDFLTHVTILLVRLHVYVHVHLPFNICCRSHCSKAFKSRSCAIWRVRYRWVGSSRVTSSAK